MRSHQCLLACVLLLAGADYSAADEPPKLEFTPFIGYAFGGEFDNTDTDANAELDDASTLGLLINFPGPSNTQWEIMYSQQNTELDTSEAFLSEPELDMDVHYLHGGGTYLYDGDHAQPYVAGTIGLTHFDPSPSEFDSETYASLSVGLGLRIRPEKGLGIRIEGRFTATLVPSDKDLFCRVSGGSNVCAIRVDGDIVSQFSAFAGLTFRF